MPETLFKARLAECRRTVELEPDHDWKSFDLMILDRWQKHPDVERTWKTIQEVATHGGLPPLWAGDLVEWVLARAREQKRLVDEIVPQAANLEQKVLTVAEKNWRAGRRGKAEFALAAGSQAAFAHEARANRLRVLGRQPNPRKLFIKAGRNLMIVNCGQPLDDVVEMLLFVATGKRPKDNEIRDALKATTRRGRDTREQK